MFSFFWKKYVSLKGKKGLFIKILKRNCLLSDKKVLIFSSKGKKTNFSQILVKVGKFFLFWNQTNNRFVGLLEINCLKYKKGG